MHVLIFSGSDPKMKDKAEKLPINVNEDTELQQLKDVLGVSLLQLANMWLIKYKS